MAVDPGELTEFIADKIVTQWVAPSVMKVPTFFRMGEGGYHFVGPNKVPNSPSPVPGDPGGPDLDIIINAPLDPNRDYFVQKAFIAGDVINEGNGVMRMRCFLDFSEANDNGHALNPEFYEIGVYDSDGDMIAYATFDVETKTPLKQLQHDVRVNVA